MRPGTHHLLRLKATGKLRIGIYSSATSRTVTAVHKMLEDAAGAPFLDEALILCRRALLLLSVAISMLLHSLMLRQ